MATIAAPTYRYVVNEPGITDLPETNEARRLPEQVPVPEAGKAVKVISMPAERPSKLLFGALKDPACRLVQPIPLDVSEESGTVVLTWSEIDEFGYGGTL